MKGHVRQRSNGKWEYSIPMGKNLKGVRKRTTAGGFPDKESAEKALINKLYEINAGLFIEPSKETVQNFFTTWVGQKRSQVKHLTYHNYEGYVRNHIVPHLGHVLLSRLTSQHIQHMYSQMLQSNTAQTIKHLHRFLSQGLKHAVKLKIIKENPADNCMLPRIERKELKCWDVHELKQFLDYARSSRWYVAFMLAAYTGARLGEVLALRWEDVDLSRGTVTIRNSISRIKVSFALGAPKTKSSVRTISLPPLAVQELKVLKNVIQINDKRSKADERLFNKPKDFIVHTYDGNFIHPSNFIKEWRRLLKESQVRGINFHSLRHTHATLLLEAGINMKAVSRRLGHSTINMTLDTYSHVTPQMEEGVSVALERLLG